VLLRMIQLRKLVAVELFYLGRKSSSLNTQLPSQLVCLLPFSACGQDCM